MTEERLPSIHPGEVLLEDFMKPLGLSQYRVAQDIGVPALRMSAKDDNSVFFGWWIGADVCKVEV